MTRPRFYDLRKSIWLAALLLAMAALFARPAVAPAQKPDSPSPLSAIAPFLDEQTIAVVRVDTTRINVEGIAAQIAAFPLLTEQHRQDVAALTKRIADALNQFREAGGRDVYFLLDLDDTLEEFPPGVIPLHDSVKSPAIDRLLVSLGVDGVIKNRRAIAFGTHRQLRRLQSAEPPVTTVPPEAFDAVLDFDIQLFAMPSDDHRRVLSEFLARPTLGEGGASNLSVDESLQEALEDPARLASLAFNGGLQWAAVGIKTSKPISARLVIGSNDEASAQALGVWISVAIKRLKQQLSQGPPTDPDLAMLADLFDPAIELLTPKVEGNRLSVVISETDERTMKLWAGLGLAVASAVEKVELGEIEDRLKRIALAMHQFHDTFSTFPPAASHDKYGKPLLSWRVHLLPFLGKEYVELYKQFRRNEPWDSEHNKSLAEKMPDVYVPRNAELRAQRKTTYVVPVGAQSIFGPMGSAAIKDLKDGTANTVMVLNIDDEHAVVWTKPEDFPVDDVDLRKALFENAPNGFMAAMADGTVRRIKPSIADESLRAIFTRNAGDIADLPN